MATVDRIQPSYTAWTPSASGLETEVEDDYVGRHRKPGGRGLSMLRMFYRPRHLQR